MQAKTFIVPNISCGHCVKAIENEVSELEGVKSVAATEADKSVTVEWDDPATWDEIETLLKEINYPPA